MDEDNTYEVGYGKPPRGSQFTKGKSGNPKGRPKGSKSLALVVEREFRQRVRVNGPTGSRSVTKLEAAIMQIGNKAAQGDPRAAKEMIGLVQHSETERSSVSSVTNLQEVDKRVIGSLRRRFIAFDASSLEPTMSNPGESE